MYNRIVVPLDGSELSARAIRPALVLAEASDAPLLAVSCTPPGEYAAGRRTMVRAQLDGHGAPGVELRVPVASEAVAPVLAELFEEEPGSLVVMASVARPHTAPILGSVSEELLHRISQPLVLIGPHVDVDGWALEGPLVVPVDGSKTSEAALPLAGAWGVRFGLQPWVVTVVDEEAADRAARALSVDGPFESAHVRSLARRLAEQTGIDVEFEVLHGEHPAATITEDARERGAALVVASTHGHTGAHRVAAGSVAIAVVHHAPCPVLLVRPPVFAQ
jgi:nucleotide-binding universal stress UspA family protein